MDWISVEDRLPEAGQPCLCAHRFEDGTWWFGCAEYRDFGFPFTQFDNPNPVTYWTPINPPATSEDHAR